MSGRVVGCVVWWMGKFGGDQELACMRYAGCLTGLFMAAFSAGCSNDKPQPSVIAPNPERPILGEDYETARDRLIKSGWIAVSALCSAQNLCEEHPELATNMSDAITCGSFTKDKSEIRVCSESIPDRMNVKSIHDVR